MTTCGNYRLDGGQSCDAAAESVHSPVPRGLLVHPNFARRFLTHGKVWELKSHSCRCMQSGQLFYLCESAVGQNTHGLQLTRVLAVLEFVENLQATHYAPDSCWHDH